MLNTIKEFKPSSWAINNRTAVYILTLFILVGGGLAFNNVAKEAFPQVIFPQILVTTIYPGTSPENMETLISKQIEKDCKGISGVKKITSSSVENFSTVIIEFNTTEDVQVAKQRVKDAVDKAKLPTDLKDKPIITDVDISQQPIMNVHLAGNLSLDRIKVFADILKNRVEGMKEITRVDLVGAPKREIQVNVDLNKMLASSITFTDIERAIAGENLTISGGSVNTGNLKRNFTIAGEYKNPELIKEITVRGATGAEIKIKDLGEVVDTYEEADSYARLEGKNVITLNVIKRSGQNLINATDQVRVICTELEQTVFPSELKVVITGEQARQTRTQLHDLVNTIVIGFILVTIILLFFMGTTNALFVALSVPISMCMAMLVEPSIFTGLLGFKFFSLNFMVLFSFLLALGIVVDDAIVVIENTHRIFNNGKVPIRTAAKIAAGEVFLPVLSGTLTTLAPFFPLAFWQGVIGKFMFYIPITMIVVLFSSLLVAYLINPVFAADFMKPHVEARERRKLNRGFYITSGVFVLISILCYGLKFPAVGNFMLTMYGLYLLDKFVLHGAADTFQQKVWPKVQNGYANLMTFLLKTNGRARGVLIVTVGLFILSFILIAIVPPKVVFFPKGDPNYTYIYIKLPVGTDVAYTNQVTKEVERRVFATIGEKNPLVESVISNVAVGATDPTSYDFATNPHMAKVSVAFVQFDKRKGKSTGVLLEKIRDAMKGIPGTEISVDQESGGPPTEKPISIDIQGDDFDAITQTSTRLKRYLDSLQIDGVEELKSDLNVTKPEAVLRIDRDRALREGISTVQVGSDMRTALFGKEVSKFKTSEDDYPINLRLIKSQRENVNELLNQKIVYRDMNMGGQIREVPLSSIAQVKYGNTLGGIKRKNQKRVVNLSSNVLTGFNPNLIVAQMENALASFKAPEGVTVKFGGEQEQQQENAAFLGGALLTSIGLIMVILVLQFNSVSKMLIIVSEILFSVIGVLLGFIIFRMEMSIIMTGIGIVALAGIVVRNGILMVEFTEILLHSGMPLKEAIIEAGKTRMTPVILTATATILGLIPLAIGLNIDFAELFSTGNPHLFFGGDSVAFWGPLSWTIIFGLAFATLLTLILVPSMLLLTEKSKMRIFKNYNPNAPKNPEDVIPEGTLTNIH